MISKRGRTLLTEHLTNLKSALQTNDIRLAKKICTEMQNDLNKIPSDIEKLTESLENYYEKRKVPWYRVFTKTYDSGWLLPGNNSHASAKYHARKHLPPGTDSFYICKMDFLEEERQTETSAENIWKKPEPIWNHQKEWANNSPIPKDKPKPKPQKPQDPGPDMAE